MNDCAKFNVFGEIKKQMMQSIYVWKSIKTVNFHYSFAIVSLNFIVQYKYYYCNYIFLEFCNSKPIDFVPNKEKKKKEKEIVKIKKREK